MSIDEYYELMGVKHVDGSCPICNCMEVNDERPF